MITLAYSRLAELIAELRVEIKAQAKIEGIDFTSDEFKQLSDILVAAFLKEMGISQEVFDRLEKKAAKEEKEALKGYRGKEGDKGDTGEKGEKGERGDTGVAGAMGQKGDPGIAGLQGLPGEQGPIGATGPQGERGKDIDEIVVESIQKAIEKIEKELEKPRIIKNVVRRGGGGASQHWVEQYVAKQSSTSNHNSLSGLQGGTAGEYFHLEEGELLTYSLMF